MSARPAFFVILSAPRSGSWLLWTSLAQNPRAALYGELFNDEVYENASPRVQCSPRVIKHPLLRPGQRSDDYLDGLLARFAETAFLAVGFKLLYGQSRRGRHAARLWTYLERRTDIRVIHLVRENLFEGLVSLKAALATDRWTSLDGREREIKPMLVTPDECRDTFKETLRARRDIARRFRRHEVLELGYESDLVRRYPETMKRAQEFLGLSPCRVSQVVSRQASRPVSERVANYGDLRRTFAGTKFASYFRPDESREERA